MTWFKWLLIVLFAVDAVGFIFRIGLPRQPVTKGTAASQVIGALLLILGVIFFG